MPVESLDKKIIIKSVASPCQTDGCEESIVYGVAILYADEIIFEAKDVSTNELDVHRLILLMKDQDIPTDQYFYIVEDYIQQLYM